MIYLPLNLNTEQLIMNEIITEMTKVGHITESAGKQVEVARACNGKGSRIWGVKDWCRDRGQEERSGGGSTTTSTTCQGRHFWVKRCKSGLNRSTKKWREMLKKKNLNKLKTISEYIDVYQSDLVLNSPLLRPAHLFTKLLHRNFIVWGSFQYPDYCGRPFEGANRCC